MPLVTDTYQWQSVRQCIILHTMRRDRVKSSVILAAGYDAQSRVLEVEFHSGRIYQYFDVPRREYETLLASDSIGKYFNEVVKANHRGARVVRARLAEPGQRAERRR
jgi:hypothetical protein